MVNLIDLLYRIRRKLRNDRRDYRHFLFDDLKERIGDSPIARLLEIGPKDGEDTVRLQTLSPEFITLVDLPDKQEAVEKWLKELNAPNIELLITNLMYGRAIEDLEPYDIVWCTGVLYHNPEQLRMIRKLYELTRPGGYLILETATARRSRTRDENVVEIWHNVDKPTMKKYHLSQNVTHLPSSKAVKSWMELVGYEDVKLSQCHNKVMPGLARARAAFIGQRPLTDTENSDYYTQAGLSFKIGNSL